MNYAKQFVAIISIFLLVLSSNINVYAVDTEITKTATFTSESKNPSYDEFEDSITENESTYALQNVEYEKLGENNKTEKKDKTTTIQKTNLSSKSYSVDTNASYYHQTVTVDGKEYQGTLTKVDYDNHTKTDRYGEVSGNKSYGLRTSKPTPPDSMSLNYYDSDTGTNLTINAPLTELKTTSSEWQDYTYMNIVVSNYTDTQFMFNDKIIKHNGITVLSSDYYSELLSMAGFSDDNHKISSVYWTGDAYKNGSKKYRNARADIQAYACSYTANYYKRFSLNDVPSYTANLTYKYSEEKFIKTEYEYKATALYKLKEQPTEQSTKDEATKDEVPAVVKTITTISVLLVLSLGFVLLTMFLLTKIKVKKKQNKQR